MWLCCAGNWQKLKSPRKIAINHRAGKQAGCLPVFASYQAEIWLNLESLTCRPFTITFMFTFLAMQNVPFMARLSSISGYHRRDVFQ
jgi:hypothetical protein